MGEEIKEEEHAPRRGFMPSPTRVDLAADKVASAILEFKSREMARENDRKAQEIIDESTMRSPPLWTIISDTVREGKIVDATLTLVHNQDAQLAKALVGVATDKIQEALKKACEA